MITTIYLLNSMPCQSSRPRRGAQHEGGEYGETVDAAGRHSGGPFRVDVTPKMRVLDLRRIVQVRGQCSMFILGESTGRKQLQM